MPELAEVALYARDLNEISRDQKILKVTFPNQNDWGSTIIPAVARKKFKSLTKKSIQFQSHGKALQLHVKGTASPLLEFRLGMTGQFHLLKKSEDWRRHYFLALHFEQNTIYYADPRRFGRVIDPISRDHALGGFAPGDGFWISDKVAVPGGFKTLPRITWLLSTGDQTGVGNYMANEALGALKLSPFLPCSTVTEAKAILKKCRDIARKSFKYGGNSFGSGYYLLNGEEGKYSKFCRFYQNQQVTRHVFRGRPVFSHFAGPNL
ncbi:MAG: DNA-formamidopyrimidine glycosylase family protein [Pseudomonadota bacterium]|nr:DNA-formamidopyrimidine glycosylase family protein [Pseudomonadota bacterium]